ncbi:MAG: winged helix-turn-helix transcriptional regulator [Desulfobacteraceae bacterium]|nr:winged helix-turn-helix transcriptional regulator [Desulfobacteraceae bacterium]MCB9494282.1 winged helix-turn-helix transcriptional regulator [Desulfobacteraceae bacterium]
MFPEVPPRVEYCLTEKGKTLEEVMEKMKDWGEKYSHL